MFVPPVAAASPPFVPTELTTGTLIAEVAKKCFQELAASMAIGTVVALFIPTPMGVTTLLSAMMVQFAVSLAFHFVGAFASLQTAKGRHAIFKEITNFCEWWTGANFAFFTGANAQTVIHETGHLLAALAVYNDPKPYIEIMPFEGGFTGYYKTPGPLSKRIGPVATTLLMAASGPAFSLLVSGTLLAAGLAIRSRHPRMSKYLVCWGASDFVHTAHYAYSALSADPSNLMHDFVRLSILGLNPLKATITILAIPILLTTGIVWWQNRHPRFG